MTSTNAGGTRYSEPHGAASEAEVVRARAARARSSTKPSDERATRSRRAARRTPRSRPGSHDTSRAEQREQRKEPQPLARDAAVAVRGDVAVPRRVPREQTVGASSRGSARCSVVKTCRDRHERRHHRRRARARTERAPPDAAAAAEAHSAGRGGPGTSAARASRRSCRCSASAAPGAGPRRTRRTVLRTCRRA